MSSWINDMRLPQPAHTSRPWRIHDAAPGFRLEDVWALLTPGAREDFPQLVKQFASGDPSRSLPGAARALWSLRIRLGDLVRPNGRLGTAYMAAIRPFRHLIVYPALMRQIAWAWQGTRRSASPEGVSG
jgi:Protein of unknown function (DUF2867)